MARAVHVVGGLRGADGIGLGLGLAVAGLHQFDREVGLFGHHSGQGVQRLLLLGADRFLQGQEPHGLQVVLVGAERPSDQGRRCGHGLHHQVLQHLPDDGPHLVLGVVQVTFHRHLQIDVPVLVLHEAHRQPHRQVVGVRDVHLLSELEVLHQDVVLALQLVVDDGGVAYVARAPAQDGVRHVVHGVGPEVRHAHLLHGVGQAHVPERMGVEAELRFEGPVLVQHGVRAQHQFLGTRVDVVRGQGQVGQLVVEGLLQGEVIEDHGAIVHPDRVHLVVHGGVVLGHQLHVMGQDAEGVLGVVPQFLLRLGVPGAVRLHEQPGEVVRTVVQLGEHVRFVQHHAPHPVELRLHVGGVDHQVEAFEPEDLHRVGVQHAEAAGADHALEGEVHVVLGIAAQGQVHVDGAGHARQMHVGFDVRFQQAPVDATRLHVGGVGEPLLVHLYIGLDARTAGQRGGHQGLDQGNVPLDLRACQICMCDGQGSGQQGA